MNFLIPSVLLFFVSSIFFFLENFVLGICLSLIAISLLLLKTGVELDPKKRRIRSFIELLSYRVGFWISLNDSTKCLIEYNREAAILSSRGSSNTVRSETFDLYLKYELNSKKKIHEFTDYKLASETSNILRSEFNLPVSDQFEEIQRKIVKRRESRRRV